MWYGSAGREPPDQAEGAPRNEGAPGIEGQRGVQQPERAEGERTGRRSRRGGRRRRRDGGEQFGGEQFGGEQRGEGRPADAAAPAPAAVGGDFAAGPEPRSFDFGQAREGPVERPVDRPVERPPVEAAPLPIVRPPHDVQEWTPGPPSDATREVPRSEP